MGKWVASAVLDRALTEISAARRMLAVAGQPADYGGAVAGRLAEAPLTAADFTLGNAGSGRQVLVGAKAGIPVAAAGTADHVALVDDTGQRLLYVTTCPAQPLVTGGSVSFDPWAVEIGAPL